jgi:Putative membrane protein insertion efficiency factor
MSLLLLALFSIILKANACFLCTMPRLKSQGISLRPVQIGNEVFAGQIKEFFASKGQATQPLLKVKKRTAPAYQMQVTPSLVPANDMKSEEEEKEISIKEILISWIRWYRNTLSPIMPPNCRFLPSCSNYAMQAIAEHGSYK